MLCLFKLFIHATNEQWPVLFNALSHVTTCPNVVMLRSIFVARALQISFDVLYFVRLGKKNDNFSFFFFFLVMNSVNCALFSMC